MTDRVGESAEVRPVPRALAFAAVALLSVAVLAVACTPTKKKNKKETPSPTITPTATYPYFPIVLNSFEAEPEIRFLRAPDKGRADVLKPIRGWRPEFAWKTDRLAA